MKILLVLILLTGCGMTSQKQRTEVDTAAESAAAAMAAVSTAASMQSSHQIQDQSQPITIICIQNTNGKSEIPNSPCFSRQGTKLPGDDSLGVIK